MITVSIVSHGHGPMVGRLASNILKFPEVKKIILTLNIPEFIEIPKDSRIDLIQNITPKGFGANHNQAFSSCDTNFFCVLNPDITFDNNPFSFLLNSVVDKQVGLVAPMVKNLNGAIEDSARKFITPLSVLRRRLFGYRDSYEFQEKDPSFFAEWVGGMCMLFQTSAYLKLGGFDEEYFMYVEDADICARLWEGGYRVIVCPNAIVFHQAHRASRHNLQHLGWHAASLCRYFSRYWNRVQHISQKIELLNE